MLLSPRDQDKFMVVVAAGLAAQRLARGLRLNYPEAVAFIAHALMEGARDGRSVPDLMDYGTTVLDRSQVMPGVAEMVDAVQIEATFPDGTKLVTVHHPIASGDPGENACVPGEILTAPGFITLNEGRETTTLTVRNTGDRPVQVGSHFHFFEVNRALEFPRMQAYGMRLDIPAGTAVRFEPGAEQDVQLVALAGERRVFGLNVLIQGALDDPGIRQKAADGIGADNSRQDGNC